MGEYNYEHVVVVVAASPCYTRDMHEQMGPSSPLTSADVALFARLHRMELASSLPLLLATFTSHDNYLV